MKSNILSENSLYLKQWMSINPKLSQELSVEGNNLVLRIDGIEKKQDITDFYFPEMLYNEAFRNQLIDTLDGQDLFNIISTYCKTHEIVHKNDKNKVVKIELRNEQETPFLLIITGDEKKYRFDTPNPEKIIAIYETQVQEKGIVTLEELGRLIKDAQ